MQMNVPDSLFTNRQPYAMPQRDKEDLLLRQLNELCARHMEGCPEYRSYIGGLNRRPPYEKLEAVPFIPVSIFKQFQLFTRTDEDEHAKWKTIQSSSTSSGVPSQIFVDDRTALRQKISVQMIFNSYLGDARRPYIIFDAMETARGKSVLSARGAAIMSLMGYASQFFFVMDLMDGQLVLNEEKLRQAAAAAQAEGHFIAYGFTYILHQAHERLHQLGCSFDGFGDRTYLIHSGGWKRLQHMAVDKPSFNRRVSAVWGVPPDRVIDFYGLVEQSGVIYPDCAFGNKHVPYYADVIIREPHTLRPLPEGRVGLIQLVSALPLSAPNHAVITDDLGEIVSVDRCPCGRKGKAFQFRGRAPKVEVRGCGDVYAEERVR